MTTELSFLIELLLNHKLPPATKKLIAERVKEVELAHSSPMARQQSIAVNSLIPIGLANQAPSMQAIMARNPDIGGKVFANLDADLELLNMHNPNSTAPTKVEQIAQTPATQAALADRQAAILQATSGGPFSGKPEKGRTSPRKF